MVPFFTDPEPANTFLTELLEGSDLTQARGRLRPVRLHPPGRGTTLLNILCERTQKARTSTPDANT